MSEELESVGDRLEIMDLSYNGDGDIDNNDINLISNVVDAEEANKNDFSSPIKGEGSEATVQVLTTVDETVTDNHNDESMISEVQTVSRLSASPTNSACRGNNSKIKKRRKCTSRKAKVKVTENEVINQDAIDSDQTIKQTSGVNNENLITETESSTFCNNSANDNYDMQNGNVAENSNIGSIGFNSGTNTQLYNTQDIDNNDINLISNGVDAEEANKNDFSSTNKGEGSEATVQVLTTVDETVTDNHNDESVISEVQSVNHLNASPTNSACPGNNSKNKKFTKCTSRKDKAKMTENEVINQDAIDSDQTIKQTSGVNNENLITETESTTFCNDSTNDNYAIQNGYVAENSNINGPIGFNAGTIPQLYNTRNNFKNYDDYSKLKWLKPPKNLLSPPELQLVIVDRSHPEWKIDNSKWLVIEKHLLEALYDEIICTNDCSIGFFDGTRWQRGIKIVGCRNQNALNFIQNFILNLNKLWIGEELDVFSMANIVRQIVRIFIPPPIVKTHIILSLIKLQNPMLCSEDWELLAERERDGGIDIWLGVNEESYAHLSRLNGEIKFGINRIFVNTLPL